MNYLKDKTVYLTGPITAVKDDGIGWRKDITGSLQGFGIIVDDPTQTVVGGAGEIGQDKARFKQLLAEGKIAEAKEAFFPVVRKDLRSVDKADFLVLYYDPKIQMVGTIHELVIAHLQRKPILMFVEKANIGDMNPWILTFIKNGCIFTSWQDMMIYLKDVDDGKFNTSYWTL